MKLVGGPRFLILGASGFLGRHIAAALASRGIPFTGTSRRAIHGREGAWLAYDFPADDSAKALGSVAATHVIVAARLAEPAADANDDRVRLAFQDSWRRLIKVLADDFPGRRPRRLVYISSDAVFSGRRGCGPRSEVDEPDPDSEYGRRQHLMERLLASEAAGSLILRTSYLCSGPGEPCDKRWRRLSDEVAAERTVRAATNLFKSPIPVDEAARLAVQAAISKMTGIFHLPGTRMSVFDFLVEGLRRLDLLEKRSLLQPFCIDPSVDTSLCSARMGELVGNLS